MATLNGLRKCVILFLFFGFCFSATAQVPVGNQVTMDFTGLSAFAFSDQTYTFTEGGQTYKVRFDIPSSGVFGINTSVTKTGISGEAVTFTGPTIISFDFNNDGTFGGDDDVFDIVSMNVGNNSLDGGTLTSTGTPDANSSKAFSITSTNTVLNEFDPASPGSAVSGTFTASDYTGIKTLTLTTATFSVALDNFVVKRGSLAPAATAPTISTSAASSVSVTTATLGGNISSDGGATITERGVVWSTSDTDPQIGDAGVNQNDEGGTTDGSFSESISALPANTTIYFNAYAINSAGTSYGTADSFTTAQASFALTVLLEGPFASGSMSTTLKTNNQLPTAQPYKNPAAETSSSIPATAVDWIEVELRTGTGPGTRIGSRAAFVLSSGTVVDKDGNALTISSADGSDYYIVIHHRNHLSIMTPDKVSIASGTYTHNFTTGQDQAFGTTPMVEVDTNVFAMYSGDADDNGTIDGTDLTSWRGENGKTYVYGTNGKADLNLDGVINAVDRNDHQQKNSGKSSDVSL